LLNDPKWEPEVFIPKDSAIHAGLDFFVMGLGLLVFFTGEK
jgi:hypothetical protein